MPTTLDEFYKRLDALEVTDDEKCIEFGYYLDKILREEVENIHLTETDLRNAGGLKSDEHIGEEALNAEDNTFASARYAKFLEFNKISIERLQKLAKVRDAVNLQNSLSISEGNNNPALENCEKRNTAFFRTATALQGEKKLEQSIIDNAKQELEQELANEKNQEKTHVINQSLAQLNGTIYTNPSTGKTKDFNNHMSGLSKAVVLDSYLCPQIAVDQGCYQLRTNYVLGKYLLVSEQQELFGSIISETRESNKNMQSSEKKNFEKQLVELENKFARAGTIDERNALINEVKKVKKFPSYQQSVAFNAEIHEAKEHVNKLPVKEKEKGHYYLQSLVDCFHAEKSFEKREVVLDAAKKTNAYLTASEINSNDIKIKNAKDNLLDTTNKLDHVAHGKKAVGRLMMFVGAMALVAGVVATPLTAGGGALLAAAGAGMVAAGKLTVAKSKNTMEKPATQAFFKPAPAGQAPANVANQNAHSDNNAGVEKSADDNSPRPLGYAGKR